MVSGQCPAPEPAAATQLGLEGWLRPLQQALQLEADRGFADLMGRRETFSAFLLRELSCPPFPLPVHQQQALAELSQAYGTYADLSLAAHDLMSS